MYLCAVADRGFRRLGCAIPGGGGGGAPMLFFNKIFAENCMKIKEFESRG